MNNTLTPTKGITLKTASGRDNTTISGSGVLIAIVPDATAVANEEVIRVEGLTLDGNNVATNIVTVQGASASSSKPFENLAIGNCRIRNSGNVTSGSGAIRTNGQVRGAIFGNIFDRCNVIIKCGGNDDPTEWANGHFPQSYGTSDNLFFENNTIKWSSSFSGGDPGWTEIIQGGRLVIRYCTWDMANCSGTEIWDIHGFQNWPGNGQTGTMVVEYYGNTIRNANTYRILNHRGGWGLFFNNIITGTGAMSLQVNQYAAGDLGGSGCTADAPGASGVYRTEVLNTYAFNNTVNGNIINLIPGPIGDGCGISQNNGYWNYNSSFNGTSGIGRGTSAPGGNPTVGVAYWKASNINPTTDPNVIQSGTLYKCVSGNTWTAYYAPYTYPHPLASGSLPTPTPTPTPTPSPSPGA